MALDVETQQRNKEQEERELHTPAFLKNLKTVLNVSTTPALAPEYFALAESAFYRQDVNYRVRTRVKYLDRELIGMYKTHLANPAPAKPLRLA
jgi:hypothetical protein